MLRSIMRQNVDAWQHHEQNIDAWQHHKQNHAYRHEIFYFIFCVCQVRVGSEYDVQKVLSYFYSVEIAFVAVKSMPR